MSSAQKGTAMVELAIIMPFLVILVFGIAELGRALYQEQILVKSAASSARYLARAYGALDQDCNELNPPVGSVPGDSDYFLGWNEQVSNAKNLAIYAGGSSAVLQNFTTGNVDITKESRTVSGAGDECVITVSIRKLFDGAFGDRLIPMTNIGQITLNAQSEEVYIGE